MTAVDVDDRGPELSYGKPRVLFDGFLQGGGPRTHDVGRDGRFVVVVGNSDAARADELVIVLDWNQELERLVPMRP